MTTSALLTPEKLTEHVGYFDWLCETSKHPMHHDVRNAMHELVAARAAISALQSRLESVEKDAANMRTDIKAAFHELGGIGKDSSKGFHRIGIDSTRGILERALSQSIPDVSPKEREK